MPLRVTPGSSAGGTETDPVAEADLATHKTDSAAHSQLDVRYQAISTRLAEIAALNTNSTVPEQVGGVWVARSMASLKSDLALVKGDVGLGNVDNTADTAKPVSTAQQTALDLKASIVYADAGKAAVAGTYRNIFEVAGRGTTSAASATKYICEQGTADVQAVVVSRCSIVFFNWAHADQDAAGLTTKLRLEAEIIVTTAPAVTITLGLYPLANSASPVPGTVVSGSTIAFTSPSANSFTAQNSGDFTVPADGIYCIGYTVSGTPSANFSLQAKLNARNV